MNKRNKRSYRPYYFKFLLRAIVRKKLVYRVYLILLSYPFFLLEVSDYQKVECGERLRDIERGKAKQRQSTKELPENLREVDKHKRETNAILANKVGMSGRQYDKARKVYHEAPEPIKKKWQEGTYAAVGWRYLNE